MPKWIRVKKKVLKKMMRKLLHEELKALALGNIPDMPQEPPLVKEVADKDKGGKKKKKGKKKLKKKCCKSYKKGKRCSNCPK